jgi:hypothetical protein
MNSKLKAVFSELKAALKKQPFILVAIAVIVLGLVVFWQTLSVVMQGILYTAIALLGFFLLLALALKLHYRSPSLKDLFAEKKRVLETLKIAEQKYMKRRLSETDFNKIFKEKQQELIKIEALIDQQYNKENRAAINKELLAVQSKKRHILQSLLDEKRRLLKEMDLMEKRYLRRKIDAKTYQDLVQKNQQSLIEIEAHIKQLYTEANVEKVMDTLKQKLAQLEEKKKSKAKSKKEEQLAIAKEIAEQVAKK